MAELGTGRPGLAFPGDAEPGAIGAIAAPADLVAGGSAEVARTRVITPTSGVVVGGSATLVKVFVHEASGGIEVSGSAPVEKTLDALGGSEPQITAFKYTGNATSPRFFIVPTFTPCLVVVLGKDGSGNLISAIKTPAMPSGKSQPLANNVSAGDASRDDRILDIVDRGFTVGDDLNESGLFYVAYAFPAIEGQIATGTIIGSGGDVTRNSAFLADIAGGTISGFNQMIDPTDCDTSRWHHPAGSTVYSAGVPLVTGGRRIIRNSDGAVIAELAVFNSVNGGTGTVYIGGFHGGSTWHLEEQYDEIAFDPDVLWVMAGDSIGASIPSLFLPGLGLGDDPANPYQNFIATGTDPSPGWIPDGERVLHHRDNFNALDVPLYWVAFKAAGLSTSLNLTVVDYIGENSAPQDIDGVPYRPEAFFNGTPGATYRFALRDVPDVLDPTKTLSFWDGQSPNSGDIPTFLDDGLNVPAISGWNLDGRHYRAMFFASVLAPTGVVVGGAADIEVLIDGVLSFEMEGSGGVEVGVPYRLVFPIEGSGGVEIEGAADVSHVSAQSPTGGAVVGGAADLAFNGSFEMEASGGVEVNGAADIAFTEVLDFEIEGSGGVEVGGSAAVLFVSGKPEQHPTGGGGGFGGRFFPPWGPSRPPRPRPTVYQWVASGGVVVGGKADVCHAYAYRPEGGVVVSGEAALGWRYPFLERLPSLIREDDEMAMVLLMEDE